MVVFASIFGGPGLVIVLVVALILLGPKEIPKLMHGLGKGISELRKGIDEGKQILEQAMNETAASAPKLEIKAASDSLPRAEEEASSNQEVSA